MDLAPHSLRIYIELMARCGVKNLSIYYIRAQ